jgi:hypothetical protein
MTIHNIAKAPALKANEKPPAAKHRRAVVATRPSQATGWGCKPWRKSAALLACEAAVNIARWSYFGTLSQFST